MRHWTEQTDTEANELYPTFTEAKIRQYQDLARAQIRMAYDQGNEDAMADLQAMEDALFREMMRRTDPRKGEPQ